jgi:hypothetical protein
MRATAASQNVPLDTGAAALRQNTETRRDTPVDTNGADNAAHACGTAHNNAVVAPSQAMSIPCRSYR